jgi:hypothetical protein
MEFDAISFWWMRFAYPPYPHTPGKAVYPFLPGFLYSSIPSATASTLSTSL